MLGFGFRCKSLCLKVPIKCKMYLAKPCDFHRKWSMWCQNQLLFPRNSTRVILLYSCIISRKCGKAMTTSKKKNKRENYQQVLQCEEAKLVPVPFYTHHSWQENRSAEELGPSQVYSLCMTLSQSLTFS